MGTIDYAKREMNAKIVFFGPNFSGRLSNIQHFYDTLNVDTRSKFDSIEINGDKVIYYDFTPLAINKIRDFQVRFHIFSITGSRLYDACLSHILKGVDGIVFIADSQQSRMEENQESLDKLRTIVAEQGYSLDMLPFVIQYNKRDLPDIVSVEEMRSQLNPSNVPDFEGIAINGIGVSNTFKAIVKLVLTQLKKGGV